MTPAALVVDASVAVKWGVTAEVFSVQAQALLTDCLNSGRALIGPPHLSGEVANALYRRIRSQDPARQLTAHEAERALRIYLAVPVTLLSPADLYEQAFALAQQLSLPTIYDAIYVVLARLRGVELWTADQRLLTALGTRAPWVRDLSTYPTP